jgi:hypothetical protein
MLINLYSVYINKLSFLRMALVVDINQVAQVGIDSCETLAAYLGQLANMPVSNEYMHLLEVLYERIGMAIRALRARSPMVNQARRRPRARPRARPRRMASRRR